MGNIVRWPQSGAPVAPERRTGRLLRELLASYDPGAFARRAVAYVESEGFTRVAVGWRLHAAPGPGHDAGTFLPGDGALVQRAQAEGGWAVDAVGGRIACAIESEPGHYDFGLVADGTAASRVRIEDLCELLGPVAATVFERSRMTDALQQLGHSEQLQTALFAIADMASSDMDLGDMLRALHGIVGRFMYAENFFIALYDESKDALRFIYLVDTIDPVIDDADGFIPMAEIEGTLTWYLVRDRKPLMGSVEQIHGQISGPMRDIGADSYDWLGVPVVFGERVRGVLVVQSYIERPRYTAADQALLAYVGSHILTALDRKLAQEELERRVEERTQELTREVAERQRSVRIQEALFRIAELSHTAGHPDEFYRAVHRIVGEFLDARNLYIALVSEDGTQLDFPYYVDERGAKGTSRPFGKGWTEYVIGLGRPCMFNQGRPEGRAELERLEAAGRISTSGPRSHAWLGVPMIVGERVVGVLAVQSYSSGVEYTEHDRELLTFIAYQIANGLERQRAAAALKHAYSDLERRVSERTAELSEQIEVRERIEHRLKHQVLHDPLTGLPNRVFLRDRLVGAMARRDHDPEFQFAVLFIDLDRFKVINDSVGHMVGDALLQEAARRFSRCAGRSTDMVARLGGDEFAIYMELDRPDAALVMAQRVIDVLRDPVRVDGKELFTAASVGIAQCAPHYAMPEDILRDADIAMYRAKAGGRGRFDVFDEQLHDEALALLETENELRRGVTRGEFIPFFQPIVRLADGGVVGYEALMRWRHPEKGVLAPGAFLQVAEASGVMELLDWQIFEHAMRVAPELLQPGQYVNLNFSARHFRSPDLDVRFVELMRACGVKPGQVRIEVTEGALLENPEQVGEVFRRLQRHGVEIALDDFGTGYSSLSYLHRFHMHTLKIDRSFINDLHALEERSSAAVVRAILALARSQRMEVVAEGIETQEQRDALLALGCELGQGYLFARPQSLADLLAQRG